MDDPNEITADGRLIWKCQCGRETRVKNLRYRVVEPPNAGPCDVVHDGQCPGNESDGTDPSLNDELGWCACGNPEMVESAMLEYLEAVSERRSPVGMSREMLIMAYIADDLGWTEHGGGVYGAWLDSDGIEALQILQSRRTAGYYRPNIK